MKYLVTGGQNRVTVTYLITTEDKLQAKIAHLQSLGIPELQWVVMEPADINPILCELQHDPLAFRIRNGAVERRPMAWVRLDNTSPRVGGVVSVDVDFSAEPTVPKLVEVNGVVQEAPFTIECDAEGVVELVPISAPHYCYNFTLRVSA